MTRHTVDLGSFDYIKLSVNAVSDPKIIHLQHAAPETLHEERRVGTRKPRLAALGEKGANYSRPGRQTRTHVVEKQAMVYFALCGLGLSFVIIFVPGCAVARETLGIYIPRYHSEV